jgi:hypothetical protein
MIQVQGPGIFRSPWPWKDKSGKVDFSQSCIIMFTYLSHYLSLRLEGGWKGFFDQKRENFALEQKEEKGYPGFFQAFVQGNKSALPATLDAE